MSNAHIHLIFYGLPWWLSCKESACNAGDLGSILGLGRFPGEENGSPLQYSGKFQNNPGEFHGLYSPWGHKESDTTKQTSTFTFILYFNFYNVSL